MKLYKGSALYEERVVGNLHEAKHLGRFGEGATRAKDWLEHNRKDIIPPVLEMHNAIIGLREENLADDHV